MSSPGLCVQLLETSIGTTSSVQNGSDSLRICPYTALLMLLLCISLRQRPHEAAGVNVPFSEAAAAGDSVSALQTRDES